MTLAFRAIKQALNGNFKAALNTNLEILSCDPDNIDALNRLGQTYLKLGKLKKALSAYRQVLKIDRFNPIAKKNLEKIKNLNLDCQQILNFSHPRLYLEEPGKTKLVTLINLGETKALANLNTGQNLALIIKNKAIYLYDDKNYIGRLPDDLSKRLIWLINRNNAYQAIIKCVEKNKVIVFLRECQQSKKNINYPSFPTS